MPSTEESLVITTIKACKIPFFEMLLSHNVDLDVVDKNAIINALETKNLYLMQFLQDYISQTNKYDNYIVLVEKMKR
uniref:Ankyrin repeat protein n=1 Tax=viral metagenome TaxID=1070528 RepID=A0A6C0CBR1_9ZZZZ